MDFHTKKTHLNLLPFVLPSLRKSIRSRKHMNFRRETGEERWEKKLGRRNRWRRRERRNENLRGTRQEERALPRKEKEVRGTNL